MKLGDKIALLVALNGKIYSGVMKFFQSAENNLISSNKMSHSDKTNKRSATRISRFYMNVLYVNLNLLLLQ